MVEWPQVCFDKKNTVNVDYPLYVNKGLTIINYNDKDIRLSTNYIETNTWANLCVVHANSYATFTYSSIESPQILAITHVSNWLKNFNFSLFTTSSPGFSSPIEFSIPPYVSATRGVGLPGHGIFATPFVVTAPSLFKSTNSSKERVQFEVSSFIQSFKRLLSNLFVCLSIWYASSIHVSSKSFGPLPLSVSIASLTSNELPILFDDYKDINNITKSTWGTLKLSNAVFGKEERAAELVAFVQQIQTLKADMERVDDIMRHPVDEKFEKKETKEMVLPIKRQRWSLQIKTWNEETI